MNGAKLVESMAKESGMTKAYVGKALKSLVNGAKK